MVVVGRCWEWQGSRDKHGYGGVRIDWKLYKVHRLMLALHLNVPPESLGVVRHAKCNNPPCCNPAHLKDGTHTDNIADKVAAGRQAKGKKHSLVMRKHAARGETAGHAKLSNEQVAEIRRRCSSGDETQTAIAQEYGVGQDHVSRIVNFQIRKDG